MNLRNVGVRVQCLTAWRHPIARFYGFINGVIEGGRTLDLQSHNLAFSQLNYDHHMVLPEGFEPSTSALEGHCSIQLSYGSRLEQVKGIGPSQPAWKASVLPLNYTCKCFNSLTCTQSKVKKFLKKIKKRIYLFALLPLKANISIRLV